MSSTSVDEIRKKYGDWTKMSIHLGGGQYTFPPKVDQRLRRLLQIACDLVGKPIDRLRVLDLGCLEGQHAIEFAMHGAEAVAIELREPNVAKTRFAKDYLKLDRMTVYQDDVLNLSVEKYGLFDVVICSGILYHLDAPDVFHFIRHIYEVCTRLVIFDTHIALTSKETIEFENETYRGFWYSEPSDDVRANSLWASAGNSRSFWPTPPSLANAIARAGFSSFYECLNPYCDLTEDRRTYVAIKGQTANILSSPMTASTAPMPMPERIPPSKYQYQSKDGPVVQLAKRLLPRTVKNLVRPTLRKMGF